MRTHIDYGIYFNNDFCQIARMEDGMPVIKRSEFLKESMPLSVHFNKRGEVIVGDAAYTIMKADNLRGLKTFEKGKTNTFIEFTRTLGTDQTYVSSNTGKTYSSEELLAECFKKLKSFVQDENVKAVAITVPAKFLIPQNEAVIKAGRLAGFEQIELIPEPIAAALNFGLGSKAINGYFLVFDFQGEFNVSLCKTIDGIISIVDSDGDNWLGDKNITEAIVDEIIIPYLKDEYALDSILNDPTSKILLVNAIKHYAEDTQIQMSSKDKHSILSQFGDLPFADENGDEPELDIEITQRDIERVFAPIFQKAIEITKSLLQRNNLKGSDIQELILVGGPTYSPILRRMLKEKVTPNVNTSVDPMTVVAKGAALYASTIDILEAIVNNREIDFTFIDNLKGELVLFYSDNPAMGKERFRFLLGEVIRIEKNGISADEKLKVVEQVKMEFRK